MDTLPATPELATAASEDETKNSSEIMHTYEKEHTPDVGITNENINMKNEDEFAELDAWLTSGAVEIV
jgi:hypothetical protein